MKKLIKVLKPLYFKLFIEKAIMYFCLGITVGFFIDMFLVIISKFTYIDSFIKLLILIPFIFAFLSLFLLIFKKPSYYETALKADKLGFKERFITAFEILKENKNTDNQYNKLIVDDALEKAEKADFKKLYKIVVPKKMIKISVLIITISLVVGFIPSPKSYEILEESELRTKIESEIKNIEKVKKELNLKSSESKEINAKIKELEKELRKAESEGKAIKAIQKTQAELKKISKNSVSKELANIGEKLTQNELTKNLGEQIKSGNIENMKQSIDDMVENLKNMNEEERNKMSKNLSDNLSQLAESPEAQNLINELANAMSNELTQEDINTINKNLSELSNIVENMANENSELRKAIDKLNEQMTNSTNKLEEDKMEGTEKKQDNQNDSQQNQEGNSENGNGQQEGTGQGQQGENNKGSNTGESVNGQNGNAQNGNGQDRGKGHIENENIYSREAQNYNDYEVHLSGEKNESGNIEQKDKKGVGTAGNSIPYTKIYNKYKSEALNSLEDNDIPYGVREIVKDYFSTLE